MGIGALNSETRAVFLDRDGVLNEAIVRDGKPYPPAGLAELKIYPEAASALARLKQAGYLLIVVTNQPDVARGAQSRQEVEALNAAIGAAHLSFKLWVGHGWSAPAGAFERHDKCTQANG